MSIFLKNLSHLFDVSVIKVHPLAYLGLEEEGGVVLAIVAHHPHQVELRLASPLVCHTVEQLQREREGGMEEGGGEDTKGGGTRRGEVCRDRNKGVKVNTSIILASPTVGTLCS